MTHNLWSRWIQRWLSRPPARRSVRLRLESLEERITPTTYNVADVASLQNALASARGDTGPDTIVLKPGQYNLNGQLLIDNNNPNFSLTIKGNGATASATVLDATNDNYGDGIFFLLAGVNGAANVFFDNLTIQHGHNTTGTGGAITDNGDNLTLANVVVQSNSVEATTGNVAKGGGLYVDNGFLTIVDSVIRNNSSFGKNAGTSGTDGGAAQGGGIYFAAANANQRLSITNSTIADNIAVGGDGNTEGLTGGGGASGGGIYAVGVAGAAMFVSDSTLSGNSAEGGRGNGPGPGLAEGGGADLNLSNSTFINSTIAKNIAITDGEAEGGGVFFATGNGVASLTNVTVAYNQALGSTGPVAGGGLDNANVAPHWVQLTNTLVALNTARLIGGSHVPSSDVFGDFLSGGHNLIGNADGFTGNPFNGPGDRTGTFQNPLNPVIGPLADNGGPTQTIALLPGSPAINAGDNNYLSITGPLDQRGPGFGRVSGFVIDIGSFEVQLARIPIHPLTPTPTPTPTPAPTPTSPPSLFQAILGLYIAEVEKDMHFGDPAAVQDAIHFNAQFTVILGMNIAPLIEQLADANVQAALGGSNS